MRTKITSILILVLVFVTGCQGPRKVSDIVIGPDHQLANFHRRDPIMPPEVKTVAVLPITGNAQDTDTNQGREQLEEVVKSELDKLGRFEAIYVTREQMKKWT